MSIAPIITFKGGICELDVRVDLFDTHAAELERY